ncbi:MAG: tetratricopeptide repeat protein [Pseudomonadales bacterium]|nr:tetratricopeptide repeat protein [Pseudomonadales bacterium]
MAAHSEEEQIEALKQWWKDNGKSLLIAVAVILLGLFAFRQWEAMEQRYDTEASELYEELLDTAKLDASEPLSAEEFSTAEFLNSQLRNDYENSTYARLSALLMAAVQVRQGNLDQAETELSWILDHAAMGLFKEADPGLLFTARLRLARVVLAQGDAERALTLLNVADVGAFAGSYAEVEGDAHLALGQTDKARAAYQRALSNSANAPLLELKLQDLAEG